VVSQPAAPQATVVWFAGTQAVSQDLQVVVLPRSASQPFESFPSQSANPGLHPANTHTPWSHDAVPFVTGTQSALALHSGGGACLPPPPLPLQPARSIARSRVILDPVRRIPPRESLSVRRSAMRERTFGGV
jgi:hypothetical protein